MDNYTRKNKKGQSLEEQLKLLKEILVDLHIFAQKYDIGKLEGKGKLPTSRQNIYLRAKRKQKKEAQKHEPSR